MRLPHRARLVTVSVVLLLMAGCGASDRSDSGSQAGVGDLAGGADGALLSVQDATSGRSVVYTADVTLRVSSADRAGTDAVDAAQEAGGFLFSQDADDQESEVALTLKVPSDRFEEVLKEISALGDVLRRKVEAADVTAEVTDVAARLRSAEASADRLRRLISDAGSVGDVVAIEGELAKREAEVESLQGRLRVLDDQVELATLTVRLTEDRGAQVADDLPGFLGGLRAGLVTVANIGSALLVVAGFLLPFVPFAAGAAWLIRRVRRRRHRVVDG